MMYIFFEPAIPLLTAYPNNGERGMVLLPNINLSIATSWDKNLNVQKKKSKYETVHLYNKMTCSH